jgi:ribonuclease HII
MIEDQNWTKNKNQRIIGADEVGRGSLAGPIVGAAVKLEFQHLDLLKDVKDSKKLSPKKREEIYERVKDNKIEFSISECSNLYIDQNGISVSNKEVLFNSIKIDKFGSISLVRGEDNSYSIALASIIAKVYRDNLMVDFGSKYPQYLFEKNKGYGTREHLNMIQKYGVCDIHRLSFNLGPTQQPQG